MRTPRQVLYLDPYHTASHRLLAETLRDRSRHRISLLTLPPRKWKWRMRGAALSFEARVRDLPGPDPEALITTDFLNLPEFLALSRRLWSRPIPAILYFHENQLTYPSASSDIRDFHFGLVNLYSALTADRVLFNSRFHREEFLQGVDDVVRKMPDFRPEGLADRIRRRSEVLGLPVEVARLEARRRERREPWILWNHRWEEDKNPAEFFQALYDLDARALKGSAPEFRVLVLGQTYQNQPAVFEKARRRLAHRIEHWGFVESREEYLDLVARCAVVVSTSLHEFFGVSVVEAILLGCTPVVPRRLAYPEIVGGNADFLYEDAAEIPDRIIRALAFAGGDPAAGLTERLRRFDAAPIVERWDALIDSFYEDDRGRA